MLIKNLIYQPRGLWLIIISTILNKMLEYIIQFIIGGTLFTLLYYFSKKNNTIKMAILIALPIRVILSYFYSLITNTDLHEIYSSSLSTIGLTFAMVILAVILLSMNVNKNIAFWSSLIFWVIGISLFYNYSKQKIQS